MLISIFAPLSTIIANLIVKFGYPGIFAITFLENVVTPIPSEFVFPFAGFLATQGKMNIWATALAGAIGSTLAATFLYYLGSKFNGAKTRRFVDKYGKFFLIKLEDLEKTERWFEKYGPLTVFIFRFVPIARSLISIPAGFVKMNILVFSILTFVGTFVWSFLLAYSGFILGENWPLISDILSQYEHVVLLLVIAAGVIFLYSKRNYLRQMLRVKKK